MIPRPSSRLAFSRRHLLLMPAWLAASGAGAAGAEVLVTLHNGDARLLDRQGSHGASGGLKLAGAAIVQTSPGAQLLRLEWPGGTSVDFGPDTQALYAPSGLAPDRRAALYLLRGWLKLSAVSGESAPLVLSLFATATLAQGALVHFVGRSQAWLLGESGSAQVAERPPRGAAVALGAGQLFSRSGSEAAQVLPRAPAATLREVPRAFRDALPKRYATLRNSPAAARAASPPAYAELREWLGSESLVRRLLVAQFEHWARDPALRAALASPDHPEWATVLNPQRSDRPGSTRRP